jgi:crossover junction endodeoxyribonuclease RuvC
MVEDEAMVVVGIDPGIARTGYGFVCLTEQGNLETIAYGVIETPAGQPVGQRLQTLYQRLSKLLLLHNPSTGAVEKLYFQRNVRTAMVVGQARGVAMLALAEADLEVAEFSPGVIKQAITGYGAADKKQMQQMVAAVLNLDEIPEPDDAADALAVAVCCINSNGIERLERLQ